MKQRIPTTLDEFINEQSLNESFFKNLDVGSRTAFIKELKKFNWIKIRMPTTVVSKAPVFKDPYALPGGPAIKTFLKLVKTYGISDDLEDENFHKITIHGIEFKIRITFYAESIITDKSTW